MYTIILLKIFYNYIFIELFFTTYLAFAGYLMTKYKFWILD